MPNPQQVHEAKEQTTSESEAKELAETDAAAAEKHRTARETGEALKAEMDELLDDIEAVLEDASLAVEYRQQGGE